MTRDEVKQIFMLLSTAYPAFLPDTDTEKRAKLNLWETMFKQTLYQNAELAALRYIMTCKYPPTIADMNEQIKTAATLNNRRESGQLRLPYEEDSFAYPDDTTLEAAFTKAMRATEG